MTEEFSLLTLQDYASQVLATDRLRGRSSLAFPLLGLFGETGSLLSEVRKKQRDRTSHVAYAGAVVEELGDVLWYLTAVANRGGVTLREIAAGLGGGGAAQQQAGDDPITFASLQPEHMPLNTEPTKAFETTLLQLAGDVGLLVVDYKAGRLSNNHSALAGRLVAVMRALLKAANEAHVTLEAAAIKNQQKIFGRWPREREYPEAFDLDVVVEEQLPRDLHVDIFERTVRGQTYVVQRCNEINIGDRVTDNAMTADDYRFHDVFHWAYVAVLGWSPVIRALLRVKRKSDPKIDEVEDGARAGLIEEGVTTWIFSQAAKLDYFANVGPGELPFDLLKHVRQFVAGYEAEQCPLWLWEEAVLQGYAAFRFLQKHRRGRIHVDMNNHCLAIENLP